MVILVAPQRSRKLWSIPQAILIIVDEHLMQTVHIRLCCSQSREQSNVDQHPIWHDATIPGMGHACVYPRCWGKLRVVDARILYMRSRASAGFPVLPQMRK